MAVLNSWQKLTRVLPGRPFGDGRDGHLVSATIPDINRKSCSGTALASTIAADTDANPYAVGDVVAIIQSRGTGVGQWEINRIVSVGSDSYGLKKPLQYTYTDSGTAQAQIMVVRRYKTVDGQGGLWSIPAWNGDTRGVFFMACKKLINEPLILANGADGVDADLTAGNGGLLGGIGIGPKGGQGHIQQNQAYAGEGTAADMVQQATANGTGGGGGKANASSSAGGGGGGGGHAATGGTGSILGSATAGAGGTSGGTADLTTMIFGGGGGGGGSDQNAAGAGGGAGAGIAVIYCKAYTAGNGGVVANGGSGGPNPSHTRGGGGAGGSVLIVCHTAVLGDLKVLAEGGLMSQGGSATINGGNGSVGRIAVHHASTVTGTTSPAFTDVVDKSLVEHYPAAAFLLDT